MPTHVYIYVHRTHICIHIYIYIHVLSMLIVGQKNIDGTYDGPLGALEKESPNAQTLRGSPHII